MKLNRYVFLAILSALMCFALAACSSGASCGASSASAGSDASASASAAGDASGDADASAAADASGSAEASDSAAVDMAIDPTINVEAQAAFREAFQTYRDVDTIGQILLVRCKGGCDAVVQFYKKDRGHNNAWVQLFETDAIIGKSGIGKTTEGDTKTPVADLGVRQAFGILPNPGTSIDYIDVKPTTFACDEEGEYYNQIIDTKETGHDCKGEEMYALSPEYNYGIATDFNPNNTWPDGSAIFIHCKGTKLFTGGCVAIDQDKMETVLKHADSGMRIIIGPDTMLALEEAGLAD